MDNQGNRCRSGETGGLIVFPGERDEFYGQDLPGNELPVEIFLDQHQLLGEKAATDRDDHVATGFELRHQWRRHMTGGCRDHDSIEGSVFFPAIITVADAYCNIVIPQS